MSKSSQPISEVEHYEVFAGNKNYNCACGRGFSFRPEINGHIRWQELKLTSLLASLSKTGAKGKEL